MKRVLAYSIFPLLVISCENNFNESDEKNHLTHGHTTEIEDFVSQFDTIIEMTDKPIPIDTLNYLPNKAFTFTKTNIDSCIPISKKYWDKHLFPLAYMNDTIISSLNFETDEGNQYAIISKTVIGEINLVLIGRNSFNSEMIEFYDLLITDNKNTPIYFGYLEYVGNNLKLDKSVLSDTLINIVLKGEKYQDGFEDVVELNLKFNFNRRSIGYSKAWKMRTIWD